MAFYPNGGSAVTTLRGSGTSPLVGVGTTGDTNNRVELDADGYIRYGSGSGAVDTFVGRRAAAPGSLDCSGMFVHGGIDILNVGAGMAIAEGANAKQGIATLAAGTVTVANTSVTANSKILVTCQILGTVTVASTFDTPRTAGTSFTIHASQATDTSTVAWEIFEPG